VKHKTTRRTYCLRNCGEYNAALVKRGSLPLWVTEAALSAWHEGAHSGKRGAPQRLKGPGSVQFVVAVVPRT